MIDIKNFILKFFENSESRIYNESLFEKVFIELDNNIIKSGL